jgi:DNA invertase Pin-like site-specific DNA recombinase
LGWSLERILMIDDDLGKSAASAAGRLGFQRLVSEVSLDHVALVLGVEMSRLARSNKDWHQLLELCALFHTLIADLDGVYDPAQYNDRLLLGLKGTMSEAELHILKQRMYQGRLSKARRGELTFALPTGYIWDATSAIAFDPDEQVQAIVRLIFRQFEVLGTLNGVLRYLAEHGLRLGIRVREGPGKGTLVWRRPNRPTLQNLLRHPIYAGAYAYGRRQVDPRRKHPGRPSTGRVVAGPADWFVLLRDHCPAYITWDQYEANLARLRANRARAEAMGAARTGPALLAGLVVCARCGCRLTVRYRGVHGHHYYVCSRLRGEYGGPSCRQHVAGPRLDQFVSQQALAALAPAALDLSLEAAAHVEQERAELECLWQQRRERVAYEADRAARQYHAVEPENRLVARNLERAWEEKLAAQQQLAEEYHRFVRQQPRVLSADERAAIRRLASAIPALWDAPTTTAADRKEILRQVIERIVVAAQGSSERVQATIHWIGGGRSEVVFARPVAKLAHLSTYPQLCERVRQLTSERLPAWQIAERLNGEGYRPPKHAARFGAQSIRDLQRQLGLSRDRSRPTPTDALGPNEWWRSALAEHLGIPTGTLDHWIHRGWVRAYQQAQPPRRWIIWADAAELERLRQFRARPIADEVRRWWVTAPPTQARAEDGTL